MNPPKSEHQEQVAFFHAAKKLFRAQGNDYLVPLLFAIPNGGRRDARTAASLKMEGVRAGVPDIFFARPNQRNHGLFLEMKKTSGGRVSPEQKEQSIALIEAGYCCKVVKGCNEAMAVLKDYLENLI